MRHILGFKCVDCGRECALESAKYICPACNGNLDVLYDYKHIRQALSRAALSAGRDHSMWRYRALLPVHEVSRVPPLPVGGTPLFEAPLLAAGLGMEKLLIKDDGRNPTASFKDRPSALAVVMAREAGARFITTASSGNAGIALAALCSSAGMHSVVFMPASAPPAKAAQLRIYGGQVVLVEGSYDEAFDVCLEAGRRFGWYQRCTGFNPFMTEGKKTAALEIAEQLGWIPPDTIFVSVGDGCIIGSLWKGFRDLLSLGWVDRMPRLIGVQAEGASAVVDAVLSNGIVRPGAANTVADSICVGKPRDAAKAIRAMRDSGGTGVKVTDGEILNALGVLARTTGVFVEPSAAAALAGLAKLRESGSVRANETVLLLLTGHGLKDVDAARSLCPPPLQIGPDSAGLDRVAQAVKSAS